MPPAMTSLKYGQNPTRKRVDPPPEDRRNKKPAGAAGPEKAGQTEAVQSVFEPTAEAKTATNTKPLLNFSKPGQDAIGDRLRGK